MKRMFTLFLFAALCMAGACSERRPFSEDGTYHPFFHLEDVEGITRDGTSHSLTLFHYRQPWTEDDRIYYQAPFKAYLRFREIPVYENPVFHAGFGLDPEQPQPPPGEITFRVELEADGIRTVVLDRTLKTDALSPGEMVEAEVPLETIRADKIDLYFYSESSLKPSQYKAVWCRPMLVSGGEQVRRQREYVSHQQVDTVLLDLPPDVQAGEGRYFRSAMDGTKQAEDSAEKGGALVQVVPARTVFRATLPRDSSLSFSAISLVDPDAVNRQVLLEVLVNGRQVYHQTVGAAYQNRSLRRSVPLQGISPGPATIELRSSFAGSPAHEENAGAEAKASWIYPLIERNVKVPRQSTEQGKNTLVIVVDALRADHLSFYGYERKTSPEFDRMASQSVVYDHAYAQSSWTVPSTASLFTGQYAATHGVYDLSHWFLIPGVETLAGAFRRQGMTTSCFSSNPLVCKGNNLSYGFEHFHTVPYTNAAQLNRAFLDWLDMRKNERFFAYLHYMEPHSPFAAPGAGIGRFMKDPVGMDLEKSSALRSKMIDVLNEIQARDGGTREMTPEEKDGLQRLVDLYDAEIAYWDERFTLLLDELDARGILENTVIVVTSDHGEEFGDHGLLEHGNSLYNELLQVPLIFFNTGAPPQRRPERAGLIDLAPTLLSMTGIPYPSTWEGKARSPAYPGVDLFAGPPGREFLFADTCHGSRRIESRELFVMKAAFSDKLKCVLSMDRNSMELFDTVKDCAEQEPLDLSAMPLIGEQMRKRIAEWEQRSLDAAPYKMSLLDDSALEKLREIGYVK